MPCFEHCKISLQKHTDCDVVTYVEFRETSYSNYNWTLVVLVPFTVHIGVVMTPLMVAQVRLPTFMGAFGITSC